MYQLIIIDDEPIVREGMKLLINWEEYGFEICAVGYDGKDGLSKVMEYSPDLVLVDIKMPGMSGIELIKAAKERGFAGKFIILTGHSDFEFAKSAISLGVRAYLLKPIDEEELIENLKNMSKELDSKKHLDDYYSSSELNARKEVLRRLLLYSGENETLRREIKQYGLDFHHGNYCVAILSPKRKNSNLEDGTSYEEINGTDTDIPGEVEQLYMEEKLVLIGKGFTSSQFESLLKLYNDKLKNIKGESLFVTVGHNVVKWEDIHFSYECAKMLSNNQFLYEEKESININILEAIKQSYDEETVPELIGNLIEVGDIKGIQSLLQDRTKYYQTRLFKESDTKVKITHNMMNVQDKFEKNYEKQKEDMPNAKDMFESIKKAETLELVMDVVYTYCDKMSEAIGASTTDNVVIRMLAYMEKNYNLDLKLEVISKMFNYNSAYLGKIFKKNTGESFNNVLDAIRIKNAKRLLIDTELKVYQVSEQVGYSNIDYFYSKFKKHVGISPKEYKHKQIKL